MSCDREDVKKFISDTRPVLGGGGTCTCKTMRTQTKYVHHCIS